MNNRTDRNGRLFVALLAMIVLLPSSVLADVRSMGPGLTSLALVPVGNPGNTPDTRYGDPGYGSVPHSFGMGKFEVTAAQYTEFLNAVAATDTYGLYSSNMSATCGIEQTDTLGGYTYSVGEDWTNRPVNPVSFWDACRFANWLQNGQPIGPQDASTTEDGAYTLNGYTGSDGIWISKKPEAKYWIPSENEWYKAAYYKGGGTDAGYWSYPTQSDTEPSNDLLDPDPGNNANCAVYAGDSSDYTIGPPYYTTSVGEFENSESPYGTYDQGGNVYEWNSQVAAGSSRGTRGGDWYNMAAEMPASLHGYSNPADECYNIGFRVAGAVPEPAAAVLWAMGIVAMYWRRPRSARK